MKSLNVAVAAAISLVAAMQPVSSASAQHMSTGNGTWDDGQSGIIVEGVRVDPVDFQRSGSQPATVRVELAARSFARTASGAISANELALQRVIRALDQLGVPNGDVEWSGYSVVPEYERRDVVPSRQRMLRGYRIVGYRAVHPISITTENVARLGVLLSTAVGAGAELIEVRGEAGEVE